MKYLTRTMLTLLATASLAACGSNAGNNGVAEPDTNAGANATTDAAAALFADAEQKMNQAMMSAIGTDAGDNWAKKMIAHHQGAIDMSQAVLDQNPKPDVAQMARDTIDKQKMDIADIQKLVKNGSPDQKSADLYQPAMMDMKQKMGAVSGSDVNQVFMRKMLEHHKGAVAMSDVALKNGVTGELRAQIEKTRSENQKEAKMVEAMLAGQSMQQAMKSSGAMTAAEMAKMPKPTRKAEMQGMDMNGMGNMDMNQS